MKITISLCTIAFVMTSISAGDEIALPKSVKQFRDDSTFYERIRGLKTETVKPTQENIDSLISEWHFVYKKYLTGVYRGFMAEIGGDLDSAEYYYGNCLDIPVHEELSYYSRIDLARIYLKKGLLREAEAFIQPYIDTLSMEILMAYGRATNLPVGYVASEESAILMEKEKNLLASMLIDLRRYNNTLVESFRDEPLFFRRVFGYKRYEDTFIDYLLMDYFIENFPPSLQSYLKTQLHGFELEKEGKIDTAIQCYQRCLSIGIENGENYYTNIDLARAFLKKNRPQKAEEFLRKYLSMLSEEIKAAKGEPSEFSFIPLSRSRELQSLIDDQEYLNSVLKELHKDNSRLNKGNKKSIAAGD